MIERRRNSGEHSTRMGRRTLGVAAVLGVLMAAGLAALFPVLAAPPLPPHDGEPSASSQEKPAERAQEPAWAAPSDDPPILEGVLDAMQVIGVGPEWRENLVSYAPDAGVVEKIRAVTSKRRAELKVEVVLGTWCGDSRREVPRFIKIQQMLGDDRMPVAFMGVDRSKQHPSDVAEGRDIQRVPTFIVLHEGREIGRIIETPKVSIEADLAAILATLPS